MLRSMKSTFQIVWFVLLSALLLLVMLTGSTATAQHTNTTATHHAPDHATATLPSPITPSVRTVTPAAETIGRFGIFEQDFTLDSAQFSNPWEQVKLSMSLMSPSGKQFTIGGFFYDTNTWKTRFSPTEIGNWIWQASLNDGKQTTKSQGKFTVVESALPGFVRSNPQNKFRWVFDNGAPYYPLGIGDCLIDKNNDNTPLTDLGFDGNFRDSSVPEYGWVTDIDTYLTAYSNAGVNLFRWSVDNCAFTLYQTIDPSGNVYLQREGLWGDDLVQKLRQHGFRTYMVIFGFFPPFAENADDAAKMDAVKRAVKYAVDRYGAYVDFWELMNESPNPPIKIADSWYNQIGQYLRSIDPYQHPISTSWQRPDLAVIDITSLHWYQKENELESDHVTVGQINQFKAAGKPIIFGEQGNTEQNWDEKSGLRMRIRTWTAFFNEAAFIFWNSSFAKDYKGGVASNIYLGAEERSYLKILQDFVQDLDPAIAVAPITISNPALARGYALRSPSVYVAYLHAYTDHTKATTGLTVTIDSPIAGTVTWIDPATGKILGTQSVIKGQQTLDVPTFTVDVVLKITG